jgi:hypothetical protein
MILHLNWHQLFPLISPINVGVARILFCAFLLTRIDSYVGFTLYQKYPIELFTPNGAIQSAEIASQIVNFSLVLSVLWKITTLLALGGLFTRLSLTLSWLIGFLFLSFPQAYQANLYLYLPLISLGGFLIFSGPGDALSIDSWWRRRRGLSAIGSHERHAFFFRMGQFLFVFFIFSSGFFKVTKTGLAWALSDNLRNTFLCSPFSRIDFVPGIYSGLGLNAWISQFPMIVQGLALLTLVAQLLVPIALFSRRGAVMSLIFFASFQLAALVTLFIDSSVNLILYLPWLNASGIWSIWQSCRWRR